MNLDAIKVILDHPALSTKEQKSLIIEVLAKDKKSIPFLLHILETEREENEQLVSDLNKELSLCHMFIEVCCKNSRSENGLNRATRMNAINDLYHKYDNKLKHIFKGSPWGDINLKYPK